MTVSKNSNFSYQSDKVNRIWHLWIPLIIFGIFVLISENTTLDISIANTFFDFKQQKWIYGESWWTTTVIHQWGRDLIATIFVLSIFTWIASYVIHLLKSYRRIAVYMFLVILFATVLVGAGKKYSNVDCPWNLDIYNGERPYVHTFSDKPDHLTAGHCFPGGHSSGGYSLLMLYFVFYRRYYKLAWSGLAVGMMTGGVFSLGQWARGAHFFSHDIWSAFICWFVAVITYRVFMRCRIWN